VEVSLEDGVDGGEQRLDHVVDHVAETDGGEDAKHGGVLGGCGSFDLLGFGGDDHGGNSGLF